MRFRFTLILYLLLLTVAAVSAQDQPTVAAERIGDVQIRIDGQLDEAVWAEAEPATDFITLRPNPGQPASQVTEVMIAYDDRGMYFGARLHDGQPDSILSQLTERDRLGNTDYFRIVLDPYQSGINGFTFIVTPDNVQYDAKQLQGFEDRDWDAVWQSATERTDRGWTAEIFLPYSALRFPSTPEQEWTVNFGRMLRRKNEESYWSSIDPNIDGFLNQAGTLTGIYDIRAPLRLQATPFVAVYGLHDREPGESTELGSTVTGGMDVKLGLNDAFTLDMTLIPDFGQARSDDQILNLGPFEQRFDENRAFFTEGVELFNKGGLFYSRRVGGGNYFRGNLDAQMVEGEEVILNPARARLYNATKVSGRTAAGTGIGLFNAVEQQSFANVRNPDGKERDILTHPLTNYNVLTVDQNLPNNSSVTLINTNVLREGTFARDANATALLFDIHNPSNAYAIRGAYKHSRLYETDELITGHAIDFEVARISGQWTWEVRYGEESDRYDINDLGLMRANNSRFVSPELNFRQNEPFLNGRFLNGGAGIDFAYRRLYDPDRYVSSGFDAYVFATTRGFWDLFLRTEHDFSDRYDFFEPRVDGRYWRSPGARQLGVSLETDGRKRWRLEGDFNVDRYYGDSERHSISYSLEARYRFSDRLSVNAFAFRGGYFGDIGYVGQQLFEDVDEPYTEVYFGTRDRNSVEAGLSGTYSFTARMNLDLRVRHYWSGVAYRRFDLLGPEGGLMPTEYAGDHDQDFDAFNIDFVYRWRFAPGSDIFLVYKSSVTDFDARKAENYADSFSQLWARDTPRSGSLSLKVVYWLDYASLFPG